MSTEAADADLCSKNPALTAGHALLAVHDLCRSFPPASLLSRSYAPLLQLVGNLGGEVVADMSARKYGWARTSFITEAPVLGSGGGESTAVRTLAGARRKVHGVYSIKERSAATLRSSSNAIFPEISSSITSE